MGVGLDRLLEGSHFLYFHKLAAPLGVDHLSLVSFEFQFLGQAFFMLFQNFDLLLQFVDFFNCLLCLFTLKSIYCFQKTIWVLNFVLNQRPQLFEQSTQIF